MARTHTHTVATIDVPPELYEFFAEKFRAAGYDHVFFNPSDLDGQRAGIDMTGIAIVRQDDKPVDPVYVENRDAPLPCFVRVGPIQFSKGVPLRLFIDAAARWFTRAQESLASIKSKVDAWDEVAEPMLEVHALAEALGCPAGAKSLPFLIRWVRAQPEFARSADVQKLIEQGKV